jgi:hypothetical protein
MNSTNFTNGNDHLLDYKVFGYWIGAFPLGCLGGFLFGAFVLAIAWASK